MTDSITVSLNGKATDLPTAQTLQQALSAWDFADKKIAAAINGDFVPRSRYAETELQAGDNIDIVAPVGGG